MKFHGTQYSEKNWSLIFYQNLILKLRSLLSASQIFTPLHFKFTIICSNWKCQPFEFIKLARVWQATVVLDSSALVCGSQLKLLSRCLITKKISKIQRMLWLDFCHVLFIIQYGAGIVKINCKTLNNSDSYHLG